MKTKKLKSACIACQKTHSRCDGSEVSQSRCTRCVTRGVDCLYFHPNNTVADPLFAPSVADWWLCMRFFGGDNASLFCVVDSAAFLTSFYSQFAGLRFIICAHACLANNARPLANEYAKKARKALDRCAHDKTIPMLQTLFLLTVFERWTELWIWNEKSASLTLKILVALQLSIDPDELFGDAMPQHLKEERRILFWAIYSNVKFFQVSLQTQHFIQRFKLQSNKVKYAKKASFWAHQFEGSLRTPPGSPDSDSKSNIISPLSLVSEILDAIEKIKLYYKQAPNSAQELIFSAFFVHSMQSLQRIQSLVAPSSALLTSADTISFDIITKFNQTSFKTSLLDTILLSVYYHSAICLHSRSRLYLTSHLTPTHSLLRRNASFTAILTSILQSSFSSARCVSKLCNWLHHGHGKYIDPTTFKQRDLNIQVAREFWLMSFAFLEAAMVLWFLTCRTQSWWWKQADIVMTVEERKKMRSEVLDIAAWIRKIPTQQVGKLSLLVEEMAAEMQQVEERMSSGFEVKLALFGREETDETVGVMASGFRIFKIDDVPIERPALDEPWGFSGLLGEAVGGRLKWNSPSEDAWSQLWIGLK
ncbi:hypothetical protein BJ741DRAFT_713936 [Chytriomyces cf. hyalinus JEL632]|nr:hypothetical protein BJ741DRAFT_713936 [Chytriomyces cf. hyalinus JEL632]